MTMVGRSEARDIPGGRFNRAVSKRCVGSAEEGRGAGWAGSPLSVIFSPSQWFQSAVADWTEEEGKDDGTEVLTAHGPGVGSAEQHEIAISAKAQGRSSTEVPQEGGSLLHWFSASRLFSSRNGLTERHTSEAATSLRQRADLGGLADDLILHALDQLDVRQAVRLFGGTSRRFRDLAR